MFWLCAKCGWKYIKTYMTDPFFANVLWLNDMPKLDRLMRTAG